MQGDSSCMRIMFAVVGEEGGWPITSNPNILEIYKHIQRQNQSAMNRLDKSIYSVCVLSCVQLLSTLWNPLDSSVHGILQARIQEWIAISYSRGSSRPKDQTHISCISCIGRQILYHWHHLGSCYKNDQFSSVQSLSCVQLFVTP